jgi:hypothetical protein
MRVSQFLQTIASFLEAPDNEALLLAEHDEKTLLETALACQNAALVLRSAADKIEVIEPKQEEKELTSDDLDHLNFVIAALDTSDNADLKKTASVLDQILLTIAADPSIFENHKVDSHKRLESLKSIYDKSKKEIDKLNRVKESEEAIDKSKYYKEYVIQEAPLNTRYCPIHPGVPIYRVSTSSSGDGSSVWQCSLDKQVYDFSVGYETDRGEKVPGGSVQNQGPSPVMPNATFDNRGERLGQFTGKSSK